MNQEALITKINTNCQVFFSESSFRLFSVGINHFRASGSNMSDAINFKKNGSERVSVVKWFLDFWFFIDLKFVADTSFISVSVFQGNSDVVEKNQLFRAEWDDYKDSNDLHPQPHWHITSNLALESIVKDYAEIASEETFLSSLEEEKTKIVDVGRIHFAMNANWQNDDNHIHPISDEIKVTKWLMGLFSHLREQLTYISEKS